MINMSLEYHQPPDVSIPYGLFFYAVIALSCVYVYSIIWGIFDAKARGKSAILVTLLIAFVNVNLPVSLISCLIVRAPLVITLFLLLSNWPLGLIVWILFRPPLLDKAPIISKKTQQIECACGEVITVGNCLAGAKISCPKCDKQLVVPPLSELLDS